jgi:hypothetical protein
MHGLIGTRMRHVRQNTLLAPKAAAAKGVEARNAGRSGLVGRLNEHNKCNQNSRLSGSTSGISQQAIISNEDWPSSLSEPRRSGCDFVFVCQ